MHESELDLIRARRSMLAALLPEVDRRRRRRVTRLASVALLLAVAAMVSLRSQAIRPAPSTPPAPVVARSLPVADPPARRAWDVVEDDPDVMLRYAVGSSPKEGTVVRNRGIDDTLRIDDLELSEWLRQAGHRPGYLRAGSRFELTHPISE